MVFLDWEACQLYGIDFQQGGRMASINKVILVGNLGAAPEVRATSGGGPVTTIRLATTDNWKDKSSGQQREHTEWHRIVFFGKLAEIAGQYLTKGASVYIEGRLQTRKWQGQDGGERSTTEIVADEMKMLGRRESSSVSAEAHSDKAPLVSAPGTVAPSVAEDWEDAPF